MHEINVLPIKLLWLYYMYMYIVFIGWIPWFEQGYTIPQTVVLPIELYSPNDFIWKGSQNYSVKIKNLWFMCKLLLLFRESGSNTQ